MKKKNKREKERRPSMRIVEVVGIERLDSTFTEKSPRAIVKVNVTKPHWHMFLPRVGEVGENECSLLTSLRLKIIKIKIIRKRKSMVSMCTQIMWYTTPTSNRFQFLDLSGRD